MSDKLSRNDLLKGLLQNNYLPRQHDAAEELPPIFTSNHFTSNVASNLDSLPLRKEGYDVLVYRRTRHPNIPRIMGIPHPRAYAKLALLIGDCWDQYLADKCASENSELCFEKHEDGRVIIQKYGRVDPDGDSKDEDPLVSFGKRFFVKTDITNFFHSIYSHSLPWALVTHAVAKKAKDEKQEWFNKIDAAVMNCQRNETKGLPIGPATSNILSEIILSAVDSSMRKNYAFSRYIDDYKAYTETREEAERFLSDLSKEMEAFSLSLNPRKTEIHELPVPEKEDWVSDIGLFLKKASKNEESLNIEEKFSLRDLKLIINKAVSLSTKHPDGSVLKYALSSILNRGFCDSDAQGFFNECLLKFSYYFPTIIPLIQKATNLTYDLAPYPHFKTRLLKLFRKSLSDGQSDNTVWCLYFLSKAFVQLDRTDWQKIVESKDPMVMLMGYITAKKERASFDALIKWAKKNILEHKAGKLESYDIDKYWLLYYELFKDNLIEAPYLDNDDNEVFTRLKKKRVSFVDIKHKDFRNYPESIFGKVILPTD